VKDCEFQHSNMIHYLAFWNQCFGMEKSIETFNPYNANCWCCKNWLLFCVLPFLKQKSWAHEFFNAKQVWCSYIWTKPSPRRSINIWGAILISETIMTLVAKIKIKGSITITFSTNWYSIEWQGVWMNNTSFFGDRILVIASNLGTYPNFFIFYLKNGKDITFKTSFFFFFFGLFQKKIANMWNFSKKKEKTHMMFLTKCHKLNSNLHKGDISKPHMLFTFGFLDLNNL
jgi:hypothetical protein